MVVNKKGESNEFFAVKGMLTGLINSPVNDDVTLPEVAERAELFFAGEEVDSHF